MKVADTIEDNTDMTEAGPWVIIGLACCYVVFVLGLIAHYMGWLKVFASLVCN